MEDSLLHVIEIARNLATFQGFSTASTVWHERRAAFLRVLLSAVVAPVDNFVYYDNIQK
jgi:hypothetical protein